MFASKRRPFAITLLISVIVALALVTATNADSIQRRDHLSLKRIVKQRSPQLPNVNVGGSADDPDKKDEKESGSPSAPAAPSASPSASPSTNSAQPTPSDPPQNSTPPDTPNSGSASASPSASQSQSAPADTPSNAPEPTPTPEPETVNEGAGQAEQVPAGKSRSTIVRTSTEQPSQTAEAAESGNTSSAGKTTLTVFIAILASVAGVTIIWTLFRRWKLSRSSQFDARMNPIDWQPSADDVRRQSSASSFHSSGHGHNSSVHGYGATDPTGLPHHDFTPGPAHLAPVGGYADLSRGPSPQPQMQESLTRGPSLNAPYGAQPGYGAQEYYGTGRQY